MLIILIHNDGTGPDDASSYDAEAKITISPTRLKTIAKGRVEDFDRKDGWRKLVERVVNEINDVS